jgi:type II secretory pathway pseudopilin PulG
MRDWIHLAITGVALLIATTLFVEWRSEVRDRAKLQATLAVAEQSLQRATTSQQDRDRQLNDAVGKLEALKATLVTQQQILARLPEILALPKPLVSAPNVQPGVAAGGNPDEADTPRGKLPEAPRPSTVAIPG